MLVKHRMGQVSWWSQEEMLFFTKWASKRCTAPLPQGLLHLRLITHPWAADCRGCAPLRGQLGSTSPGRGRPASATWGNSWQQPPQVGFQPLAPACTSPQIKIMHQALINVTRSQQALAHQETASTPFPSPSPSSRVIYGEAEQNTIHPGKPLYWLQHPSAHSWPQGWLRPCRGVALVTLAGRRIYLLGDSLSAAGSRKLLVPGPPQCMVLWLPSWTREVVFCVFNGCVGMCWTG